MARLSEMGRPVKNAKLGIGAVSWCPLSLQPESGLPIEFFFAIERQGSAIYAEYGPRLSRRIVNGASLTEKGHQIQALPYALRNFTFLKIRWRQLYFNLMTTFHSRSNAILAGMTKALSFQ